MGWTAKEIKILRLRLGWSAVDLSHRMGCSSSLILDWEKGAASPSSDDLRQLERLLFSLETYNEQVTRGSEAESQLKNRGLEQIYKYDLD